MSKITREPFFIFAKGASNNGVFGTAQLGTKVLSNDPSVIQGVSAGAPSTAYDGGWNDATISGQRLPTLEEMQGLQYLQAYMQAYTFQEGIPEWETNTIYFTHSIVKKIGTYQIYGSLIDNNVGNALPVAVTDSNWKYLGDLSNLNGAYLLASNNLSDLSSIGAALGNLGFNNGSGYFTIGNATLHTSPFIIQYGQATISAATSATFTLPTTFPNAGFHIVGTDIGASTSPLGLSLISTSQFTGYLPAIGTKTFNWIAMGY